MFVIEITYFGSFEFPARQLSEKIDAHLENVITLMAGDLLKMVISDKGYPITCTEYLNQFLNGNIVTFGSRIRN